MMRRPNWAALLWLAVWLMSAGSAAAASYSYSNTTSGAIPDGSGGCAGDLERTFVVTDNFTVDDLNVGLLAEHTFKADIEFRLDSPEGTTVFLINSKGGSRDDYNIRLDDEEASSITTINHDYTASYPQYTRKADNLLSAFDGEQANGTWTMRLCDWQAGTAGTFHGGHLEFTGTPSADPLIVTSTADTDTLGTLRYAINWANANAGDDAITFAIPGAGPHTITIASTLPNLTDAGISIDGTTQSGAACGQLTTGTPHTLMIEVDGAGETFVVRAANVTLKGIAVGNSTGKGFFALSGGDNLRVECSYWGVWADGETSAPLVTSATSGGSQVSNADTAIITNNLFSGNSDDANDKGLIISDSDGSIVTGNIIGLNADGNTALPNNGIGLHLSNATNTTVGGITAATRNIIAGNGGDGIHISDSSTGVTLLGNYIGTDLTGATAIGNGGVGLYTDSASNIDIGNGTAGGRNVIAGNASHSIHLHGTSNAIRIRGNYLGVDSGGNTDITTSGAGIYFHIANPYDVTIGGTGAGDGNVIGGQSGFGIDLHSTTNVTILGNNIGVGADGVTAVGNGNNGIQNYAATDITIGDGTSAGANIIANNTGSGIILAQNTATAAIVGNSIYNNADIGIDLKWNGVTMNDSGDVDSGANDLLNFPEINSFTSDGSTAITYDFNLDVPSNGNGYRIDFYKDSSALVTENGEGEVHLGFVDIVHAGGDLNFTGSFTALSAVSVGNIVSATTTRKTGASSYDITSEFSGNEAAAAPPSPLIVTSTADTNTLGTLRYAINHANANTTDDAITFNIPGGGVHVISPATALSNINDNGISIDGSTQPGATCGQLTTGTPHTLMIHLDGTGTADPGNARGFTSNANNVTVRGVSITGFQRQGVAHLSGKTDFLLDCAYIGVEPDGVTKGTNGFVNGVNNAVQMGGSTTSTIRNSLISGNDDDPEDAGVTFFGASGGTLEGSIIGLNAAGTAAIGNGGHGVYVYNSSNITIGGTTAATRNIIAGNGDDGIYLGGATNTSILGNYIGLGANGTSSLSNGGYGVGVTGADTLNIGNGTAGGRNVIAANGARQVYVFGTSSDVTIEGNYIGTDKTGNVSLTNGTNVTAEFDDGIRFESVTNLEIIDNVIGGVRGELIEFWGSHTAGTVAIKGNSLGFGANGSSDISSGTVDRAILFGGGYTASGVTIGGTGAGEGNTIANMGLTGIVVLDSSAAISGTIAGNIIRGNGDSGVELEDSDAAFAIYSNLIYANGQLGIDLGTDDAVTANDNGDGDTGPNDLLNFPAINAFTGDGTTAVGYDFNLDVPSAANGYRIDFYKNTSADPSGNGEGEIHLGFVDIAHAGGNLNFTGSFTANTSVSVGNIISATTTRKTASSYDITSEFSVNKTAANALIVTNTNDSGAGSLRAAIEFANANAAEDGITFGIAGLGPFTISPISALPTITDAGISIDGITQIGAACGQLTTGTQHTLMIQIDGAGAGSPVSGLTVNAANVTVKGLSIVGFTSNGIRVESTGTGTLIECSYVGVETDGVTDNGNNNTEGGADAGVIDINNTNGVTIRNNVISGNALIAATDGIRVDGGSAVATITGNIIGLDASGITSLGNSDKGIVIYNSASATIGGTSAAERNIISGNGTGVFVANNSPNAVFLGNYIGTAIDGTTFLGNSGPGLSFSGSSTGSVGDGTSAGANIIAGNGSNGVIVSSSANAAIYGNSIYGNVGLGINLNGGTQDANSVTANDSGDGDTGPNELLNYPVINTITASVTTSVMYNVNLDVPANTEGYRIEFYKNSSPDTTNGEGEIFLGFVDTGNHAGGAVVYDGTFTASTTVSSGDSISATTTRKTGATSYDITSEFAANKTAASALVVTNTNDSGAGSLRAAIEFANANAVEDNITFGIAGAGPHKIVPLSILPLISDANVTIDGTTQNGASCGDLWGGTPHTLMIEVNFSAYSGDGLRFTGDDGAIKGLSITGASTSGLYTPSDRFTLTCSYVGLEPDGTENGNTFGIAPRGADHVIGGSNVGDGNVISANDNFGIILAGPLTNLTIEGNFIGTDPTGTSAAGNGDHGISSKSGSTSITLNATRKNLISGNVSHGIELIDGHTISGASGDVIFAGNYVGVDRTGTAALPNGGDGFNFGSGSISGVTIGGTTAADRNVISGNDAQAIDMRSVSNISILGNYIGTDVTGLNGLGNGGASNTPTLYLLDVTDINIGNGTAAGRNIISDGTGRAIQSSGTATNLAINDNYIGIDVTGNTALKNGTGASATTADVFQVANVNNLDILNNVIGPYNSEGMEFWGSSVGDDIVIQGNSFGFGADGTTVFVSGRSTHGHILFGNGYAATNVVIGGTGAGEGNILANAVNTGIRIKTTAGFTGEIVGNLIYNNGGGGIEIGDTADVAIYQNTIYNNGDLGIDLSSNGVTANDSGDGDTGPNDLLNFPVINDFSGASSNLFYNIDLDVPADNYRIEFFKNSSADSSGYGEGETYLGFVEITHDGINDNFTGSFTGNEAAPEGSIISATTTRKIGVSTYDITSEFSLAFSSGAPTELAASKSVAVFDPFNEGLYALPGNDVIHAFTVSNTGNSSVDTDTIVIIDLISAEIDFYNGDIDDAGPEINPVSFSQTGGAGLTFTYATDVKYSNSGIKPSTMADCNYAPSVGYDNSVTYICMNPKGAMASGDPDPTFTLSYRARIQ